MLADLSRYSQTFVMLLCGPLWYLVIPVGQRALIMTLNVVDIDSAQAYEFC